MQNLYKIQRTFSQAQEEKLNFDEVLKQRGLDKWYSLLHNLFHAIRLDSPLKKDNHENSETFADKLVNQENVEDKVVLEKFYQELDEILRQNLTEREYKVVKLYFWEAKNYIEIGKELGISRTVVGWELKKALKKLRKPLLDARY